ncbi:adenylate/guanylate cyclase domain-containing protein [Deltaproteobacteria bacterium TL4]
MKLRFKILLLLIPLIVMPLLLLGKIAYDRLKKTSQQTALEDVQLMLQQMELRTQSDFKTIKANLSLLSESKYLTTYLLTNDENTRYGLMQRPLLEIFASYHRAYPDYYEIRILLPEGYEDARYTVDQMNNRTEEEQNSIYFQEMVQAQEDEFSTPYLNPDNQEVALFAAKKLMLKNPVTDSAFAPPTLRGYLAFTVRLQFLKQQIEQNPILHKSSLFALDDKGKVLFHKSAELGHAAFSVELFTSLRENIRNHTVLKAEYEGVVYYFQGKQLHPKIFLIAQLPESALLEDGHLLKKVVFVITFLSILLTVILSYLSLDLMILRPIKKLAKATRELRSGNYQVQLEIKSKDEIGMLSQDFIQMANDIHQSNRQIEGYNLHLEEKVKERTEDLHSAYLEISHLNQLAQTVNATLDIDAVLKSVTEALRSVFHFDAISIVLIDEKNKNLFFRHIYSDEIAPDIIKQYLHTRIPLDEDSSAFADSILKNNRIFIPKITEEHLKFMKPYDKGAYEVIKAIAFLFYPLNVQNKVIGALCFANFYTPFTLLEPELATIERYVTQIATAINNAQVYEDLKHTKVQLAETEKIAAMTKTFERFVPKQFLDRVAKEGLGNIQLGKAESDFVTILFSDIRAFTTLSETMNPQELLNFLNAYLTRMNEAIHNYGGFVDKFIGDAIMALFDDPGGSHHQSAHNAVYAAIAMQKTLDIYNKHRAQTGYPPITIGIGLHSGISIFGTVGSHDRMDTTVLGDTVNLASRLESVTKYYKCQIVVSSQTFRLLEHDDHILWRELDYVSVKGKKEPVCIFEIFNTNTDEIIALKKQILSPYHEGLMNFHNQDWNRAIQLFRNCLAIFPDDPVCQIYHQRALDFQTTPPPTDWKGIYAFSHKEF